MLIFNEKVLEKIKKKLNIFSEKNNENAYFKFDKKSLIYIEEK